MSKLEVKHLAVLLYPVLVYGFWNHDQAVQQAAAYQHLGWRFVAILLCYCQNSWVVKSVTPGQGL